ncbi:MAG: hypothetical protein ACFCUJ_10395 [Thiotrichales bacterium]
MPDYVQDTTHARCMETIQALLTVSALQVELALTEGADNVEQLGEVVMGLMEPALLSGKRADDEVTSVNDETTPRLKLVGGIESAVRSLQFYDRLSQRLMHVANGLRIMSDHLEYAGTQPFELDCASILTKIHESYVLEDEKLIFSQVLKDCGGEPTRSNDASEYVKAPTSTIELF